MAAGPIGRQVWMVAGAVVVLLLAVSARYGFHRDELYFLVAGRRLDWGYVDQPPLTPLLARLAETIGGTSPVALRVLPALAIGAVVLLAALMARRFGGRARAQLFAGVTAGGAGVALAVGHLLSTATFDYLLGTVAIWLLCGLLDGDDPRRWVILGVVVGIGLENKHLMGLLAVALLIALLVSSQRRILAGIWPYVGVVIAALIALPNFLWQAANDFPQLEMARALTERSDGPAAFVLEQVGLLSIVLVVPAAFGWWRLVRSPAMARWRPIGVAFALLYVFFLVTGGKSYYVAAMYPVLLAAGSVWFERLESAKQDRMFWTAGIGIFVGMFIGLPLLPVAWVSHADLTGELGETVGWPQLVEQVTAVYESVPAADRQETAILTGSYGEAGAIDVLGADTGLPAASSGHNNYWLWGPPERHGPVIGVGGVGNTLRAICADVEQVGVISNPWGVENEEAGLPLLLCLHPERQLADVWPDVKHFN
jgi:4-amino-4-deoxy-L-arabinose transferase-like glycosyltransferase